MSESHKLVTQLICRLTGVVFLIFFLNAFPQISGLMGENGLAPSPIPMSDITLWGLCLGGIVLSITLISGKTSAAIIFLLWLLLAFIARNSSLYFLYLWETLLLEFSFCLIWVRLFSAHANIGIWILRFLLFRLMFMMGYVKFTSTSEHWQNLIYLKLYFQNQPMPSVFSWFFFQFPDFFHKSLSFLTLVIEMFLPFLIFTFGRLRRIRYYLFWLFTAFFILIFITGNYASFHPLCIVMSICLLNDEDLSPRIRHWLNNKPFAFPEPRKITKGLLIAVMSVYIFLTSFWCVQLVVRPPQLAFFDPTWLKTERYPVIPLIAQAGLRVMNDYQMSYPYDLFSHISEDRYELVLQGSDDGQNWLNYRFRSKASSPEEMPPMYAPYQHRLDHHLFYVSAFEISRDAYPHLPPHAFSTTLRSFKTNLLLERLLDGSPAVKGLLREVPFPDTPPKMVRLLIYRAAFTDWKTRGETGHWWKYEFVREYARKERKN